MVHVLVVEDHDTNRRLLCDVLAYDGFTVTGVVNAEEALQLLQESGPVDLILMDIALPDMDGLELTRRLKASETHRDTPIVAVSAFAMKGDVGPAMEAGCVDYITKPIDTRTLSARIRQWLPPAHT